MWTGLFGRQFGESALPDFDHRMTQFDNGTAAAVYPPRDGQRSPIVYLVSENVDRDIARAAELGGNAGEKQAIPGTGWFAHCENTEGNRFSLFQGDDSAGA